ncbi:hypothetical protein D3C80_1407040 [compost metagenome]
MSAAVFAVQLQCRGFQYTQWRRYGQWVLAAITAPADQCRGADLGQARQDIHGTFATALKARVGQHQGNALLSVTPEHVGQNLAFHAWSLPGHRAGVVMAVQQVNEHCARPVGEQALEQFALFVIGQWPVGIVAQQVAVVDQDHDDLALSGIGIPACQQAIEPARRGIVGGAGQAYGVQQGDQGQRKPEQPLAQ